jgi:large subunit ribosomal protein L6
MSRIGKLPVPVPSGVEIHVGNGVVQVKGPKGSVLVHLMPGIDAEVKDGKITLGRANEERQTRAFHGLNRALIANATTGVSEGWKKELDIIGIGYRAEKQAKSVVFNLGYSHTIDFPIPEGIEIEVDGKANRISVSGIDRQQVGQIAADIRSLRPPEPYKGKGIRYVGEVVKIKAGKQGATA